MLYISKSNSGIRRYIFSILVLSVLFLVTGFLSGKISGDSFTYISLTGTFSAVIQILFVTVILMLALLMTLPAVIVDLLLLFLGWSFPMIERIWNVVWDELTIGWFWIPTSGSSILFASVILIIGSLLILRSRWAR
jgi:hypothetical protein